MVGGTRKVLDFYLFHFYLFLYVLLKASIRRKTLGELFVKPKRPQNNSDDGQLILWGNFFGQ